MLTLKDQSLVKFFQYIPEYFRCPAVARGPPIIYRGQQQNYVVCRNTAQVVKLKVHVLQLMNV